MAKPAVGAQVQRTDSAHVRGKPPTILPSTCRSGLVIDASFSRGEPKTSCTWTVNGNRTNGVVWLWEWRLCGRSLRRQRSFPWPTSLRLVALGGCWSAAGALDIDRTSGSTSLRSARPARRGAMQFMHLSGGPPSSGKSPRELRYHHFKHDFSFS